MLRKQVNTMRRLALILAVPLLLAACAGAQQASGTASRTDLAAPAPAIDAVKSGSAAGGTAAEQGIPNPIVVNGDRSVILTANIALRAKDPWATSDRAQAIATGLGGDVLNVNQSGTGDSRTASVTIRVPSARFTDAINQLKQLDAEVLTSTVSGQDVTDQFVDLQARLAAKQSEEQRYLALIARANTIDDILKIDGSLTNVRTQIEQLTGQINSIKARTDFSTIVISVSPAAVLPGEEPSASWDPARTFTRALAALGTMLRVFADFAIWLLVFGWIPLVAIVGVFAATRLRTRPAAPTA
jgi:uncharacterized protein DUF4349